MPSLFKLLSLALAAAHGVVSSEQCRHAVTAAGYNKPASHVRMSDCKSYMLTTVTPAPRTKTVTKSIYITPGANPAAHAPRADRHYGLPADRAVTIKPTHIPGYATKACSGPEYSSVCHRWGFKPRSSECGTPVKTKTVTVSVTVTHGQAPMGTYQAGKYHQQSAPTYQPQTVTYVQDGKTVTKELTVTYNQQPQTVTYVQDGTTVTEALTVTEEGAGVTVTMQLTATELQQTTATVQELSIVTKDLTVTQDLTLTEQATSTYTEVVTVTEQGQSVTVTTQVTTTEQSTVTQTPGTTPNCALGETQCGAACANLLTDSNNCGICGNPCPNGQTCTNGSCQKPCDEMCGGVCCNTSAGQSCEDEVCCYRCGGMTCIDIFGDDNNNCGGCGVRCDEASWNCVSGQCI